MRVVTNLAHEFWKLAEEYRQASQVVFEKLPPPPSWPGYALGGQSIELYLKGYLLARGFRTSELKRGLGHDLARALVKAEENRLAKHCAINEQDRECLAKLSSEYKARVFNYQWQGSWNLIFPKWVLEFASRLSQGIKPVVISDLQKW